jgi:hypothetical protein|tara:strand:- start:2126 stop:2620 length:495 start_codon:yes stop_codon:yes gene_type:complete
MTEYIDDMSLALPHQQQVGESDIDFKRFQYYLGLGASRTLKKVSNNFTISERRIKQVSSKNQWKDRLHAINRMMNEQIVSEVLAQAGETVQGISEKVNPLIFKVLEEIGNRDLIDMTPVELKGILDTCYKMIAQIYGLGTPQVNVTTVEVPEIRFKWDWEDEDL